MKGEEWVLLIDGWSNSNVAKISLHLKKSKEVIVEDKVEYEAFIIELELAIGF